jgi:Ca2+-binding EF-hand superfamily protein
MGEIQSVEMNFELAFQHVLQQSALRGFAQHLQRHPFFFSGIVVSSIRVSEFFKDFDPLRSGKCSPTQFARVLSTEKFTLPAEEVELLAQHYLEDDGKFVNYRQFITDVEGTFVAKELEKSPTTRTIPAHYTQTMFVSLTPEEEDLFWKTMNKLKHIVATRRMYVMEHFQDHDRLKNHHITHTQFKRCMPFDLSDEEIRVILKKYTDGKPEDGIDYHQFVLEISKPPEYRDMTRTWGDTTPLTALPQAREKPPEALAVTTKVQAIVLKRRIRLLEFFRDFDKLRSGICLPEYFRTAISAANVSSFLYRPLCSSRSSPACIFCHSDRAHRPRI